MKNDSKFVRDYVSIHTEYFELPRFSNTLRISLIGDGTQILFEIVPLLNPLYFTGLNLKIESLEVRNK